MHDGSNQIQTHLTVASPYIYGRANNQLAKFVHFRRENFP